MSQFGGIFINLVPFFQVFYSSHEHGGRQEFDIGLSYIIHNKFGTFFGKIHRVNPEILEYPRIPSNDLHAGHEAFKNFTDPRQLF